MLARLVSLYSDTGSVILSGQGTQGFSGTLDFTIQHFGSFGEAPLQPLIDGLLVGGDGDVDLHIDADAVVVLAEGDPHAAANAGMDLLAGERAEADGLLAGSEIFNSFGDRPGIPAGDFQFTLDVGLSADRQFHEWCSS